MTSPEGNTTLEQVVAENTPADMTGALRDQLVAALLRREDEVKDELRIAAMQSGLSLPLVNHVLHYTGLGTPMTEAEHELCHQQLAQAAAEAQARLLQSTIITVGEEQVVIPNVVLEFLRARFSNGGSP